MSYSMDRNCDKCIHHTSGMCDSWDCKMQTVEGLKKEVREKTITDIFEIMDNAEAHSSDLDEHGLYYWVGFLKNRIEREFKGE